MRFSLVILILGSPVLASAATRLDFNRDIRPILSDNCFACHGFDANKRKAGLRLDTAEGAYKVVDGVQGIKPGDPAASSILQRILSQDPDEIMPPPESHKKVTPEQAKILERWIQEGAVYQQHWAFVPPVKAPVPAIKGTQIRNPIDAFIQERLQKENLPFAAEANKETLIRRVTLDLTGLPPTVAEVDAFLADTSVDAYEKVVNRLLKSQRYGEHMGRQWLDVARYADTHGLHLDNERSMWPYRDWVVRAFNDNLPFDDFTRWQLAGDLLPQATVDQQIASGFNRCNVTTSEGGSIAEEFVFRYAVDRTDTTVAVWMGLTAGCAVCHDHKYDPISQKEFYSLYAFFNSAADPAMDGNILLTPPILRLSTSEQKQELASLDKQISAKNGEIKEAITKLQYSDPAQQTPPPAVISSHNVWFEDSFPPDVKVQSTNDKATFVTAKEGLVQSGQVALRRTATGVAQDYFSGGASFDVPPNGVISAYCYIDPENPPTSIMLQFHVGGGWNHRAFWGEEGAIPFGQVRTPSRVKMGAMPKSGEWVKLSIPIDKIGLKPGMKVEGYAFTQFGGTITWDNLSMSSRVDPAKDTQWSWKVWVEKNQGRRVEGLPQDLQTLVRGKKANEWTPEETKAVQYWWFENEYQGARELVGAIRSTKLQFESERKALEDLIPATFIMADLPQPRDSFIMQRGQYDQPGEKVQRGTPAIFPPLSNANQPTRLDLANWLLTADHPLTTRVTVNRLWQQFFGTGLVKTTNDFGSQGEPPSHPELLDWLAVHFRENRWDMKAFVKFLVTSHTYRQNAAFTAESLQRDPENRLLSRGPRYRADAEVIRDSALFVSGLLSAEIGGKGVRPYQPENIWEPVGFGGSNTRNYIQDTGSSLYRRSLYTFWKRTAPPPAMINFDAPNRESYCLRRERSNTPLQALNLMNDVQYFEAARNFAQQILLQKEKSTDARITTAFRSALGRYPSAQEAEIICKTLDQHLADYQNRPEEAKQAITFGATPPDPSLNPQELAAWTLTTNLILNLDETVTK